MTAGDWERWDAEQGQQRLTPSEAMYSCSSAVRFVAGDKEPDDRAYDYAAWYDATYVRGAEAMEELPSHSGAWVKYQDHLAAEAGQKEPEAGQ